MQICNWNLIEDSRRKKMKTKHLRLSLSTDFILLNMFTRSFSLIEINIHDTASGSGDLRYRATSVTQSASIRSNPMHAHLAWKISLFLSLCILCKYQNYLSSMPSHMSSTFYIISKCISWEGAAVVHWLSSWLTGQGVRVRTRVLPLRF